MSIFDDITASYVVFHENKRTKRVSHNALCITFISCNAKEREREGLKDVRGSFCQR